MEIREAIDRLSDLVKRLWSSDVLSSDGFREWSRENESYLAETLGYDQQSGMPPVISLIDVVYHPDLPLVLLKVTREASARLGDDPRGWTLPVRLCRGVIFDRRGRLEALPFEKIFGYGSGHPETRKPPDSDFIATVMQDGSPGIIFPYRSKFLFARCDGSTDNKSAISQLTMDVLAERCQWHSRYPDDVSLIVDVFPKSGVCVGESNVPDIVVVGVRNTRTLEDYEPHRFQSLAGHLGLLNTAIWGARTIDDLRRYIQDDSSRHLKGLVAKFVDGTRVKFECRAYRP
ncbi:MAG: hypothetical protein U9Q03_05850 [Patescibacteria group bacterium]|nr:hypothetical protein [Patescibacteria group bacterium]